MCRKNQTESFTTGPPSVAPHGVFRDSTWLLSKCSPFTPKLLSSYRMSKVPVNWLPPAFVTTLMMPPEARPYSAA